MKVTHKLTQNLRAVSWLVIFGAIQMCYMPSAHANWLVSYRCYGRITSEQTGVFYTYPFERTSKIDHETWTIAQHTAGSERFT